MADLGRCGTRTYQFSNRLEDHEPPPQLAGEEVGLVEAALAKAVRMERHRDHAPGREPLHHQSFRKELREGAGESRPPFVLEAVYGVLDGSLVRHGRAQPIQRLEPRAAATVLARRCQLDAASPAQWLLEPADLGAALVAQPGADLAATAAAGRQEEVEDMHKPSVWTRSTGS